MLIGSRLRKRDSSPIVPGDHAGVACRLGRDHARIISCNKLIAANVAQIPSQTDPWSPHRPVVDSIHQLMC
ncbi:hypothetical protein TBKG_02995 [Mycobacterium tuberculosis '98-R604 INH-RIF-EM']|nr:hypothetical protein Mb1595_p1730 [Mycobacterium tuberculosis variant bovis]EFD46979.1 predicted protein [Mycobacterium tuberculosis T17]EPZ64550.1 hypothetical protein TBKG_02995 [Mycobacterium tuberculosis '98-R604 INH-RIF-EM']EQM21498.1 hypothetical protein GuangZ0019_1585 [Mycobacterium tuberculosis GuangZ0019]